jgi:hypothetical protein
MGQIYAETRRNKLVAAQHNSLVETQVVLASLADVSELLRLLLNGGHSAKAGYLSGALRATGRPEMADEIVCAMKSAGYEVRERNPFEGGQTFGALRPAAAPIVERLNMLWEATRNTVIRTFPTAVRMPRWSPTSFLAAPLVEDKQIHSGSCRFLR